MWVIVLKFKNVSNIGNQEGKLIQSKEVFVKKIYLCLIISEFIDIVGYLYTGALTFTIDTENIDILNWLLLPCRLLFDSEVITQ